MSYLPQILFLFLLIVTAFLVAKSIGRIRRNILLGKHWKSTTPKGERLKQMLLIAFGQKKMFQRPLPAFLHFILYAGFIIINMEVLEIVLDGLTGNHRLFAPTLGKVYPFLIGVFEVFAVSVIISCLIFLSRRNIVKLRRFKAQEMKRWPKTDANIILMVEIILMVAFLTMNASDTELQRRGTAHYIATGDFPISKFFTGLFAQLPTDTLIITERTAWWAHIIGIMIFMCYIPYSKHLHIVLAFPNTYYSKTGPLGKFSNMPEVTREVKMMLSLPMEQETSTSEAPPGRFGAKDVTDFTWKQLLEAYTCTECGRCTSMCPANITGKKLSPRKILMDVRDRAEELGAHYAKTGQREDGKALLDVYITTEEIMACTTCNACTEACPVNIDPLGMINELRRYKIMEESQAPAQWTSMFANTENNFAPWAFSPTARFDWAQKLRESSSTDNQV